MIAAVIIPYFALWALVGIIFVVCQWVWPTNGRHRPGPASIPVGQLLRESTSEPVDLFLGELLFKLATFYGIVTEPETPSAITLEFTPPESVTSLPALAATRE